MKHKRKKLVLWNEQNTPRVPQVVTYNLNFRALKRVTHKLCPPLPLPPALFNSRAQRSHLKARPRQVLDTTQGSCSPHAVFHLFSFIDISVLNPRAPVLPYRVFHGGSCQMILFLAIFQRQEPCP